MDTEQEAKDKKDKDIAKALSLLPPSYLVQNKVAVGAYSQVWRVLNKETEQIYAVKVVVPRIKMREGKVDGGNTNIYSSASMSDIRRAAEEDTLWARLDHENVLKRIATYVRGDGYRATLMDYCNGGDLFHFMDRNFAQHNNYSFDDIRDSENVIKQLFNALDYLHNRMSYVHRDIKPENILLQFDNSAEGNKAVRDARLVLADFTFLTPVESPTSNELFESCGTREYMAPEIFKGEPYCCAVDCWSSGVVIFECIEGKHPFFDEDCETPRACLKALQSRNLPQCKSREVTIGHVNIIKGLLEKNALTRWTAQDVLNEFIDLEEKESSFLKQSFSKIRKWWSI